MVGRTQLKKGVRAESRLAPRKRGLLPHGLVEGVVGGRNMEVKMLQAGELLRCWMCMVHSFV